MRRVTRAPALDADAMERALEQLRAAVRARGLKNSAVRDAVARAALQSEGHFTVEDLVKTLRERGVADAHPATVYRVLPLLVETGLIQPALVAAGAGQAGQRYERAFEREHHDHIICTSCGKVVEFHFEAIEVLQRDLAENLGFQLTRHVHELFGVCASCSRAAAAG